MKPIGALCAAFMLVSAAGAWASPVLSPVVVTPPKTASPAPKHVAKVSQPKAKTVAAVHHARKVQVAYAYVHKSRRPAVASGAATAPPDSYLRYQVGSVRELVAEVRRDPVVRSRFARHFHVSGSYVADYMQKNLVESYIPRTGNYTVYCVGPSGRIYPTVQHLRGGVKVFAMRNGEPVLKWKCGNPMMTYLPVVETVTVRKPVAAPAIETIVPTESQTQQVPVEVAAIPQAAPVYPIAQAPPERTAGFVQTIATSHSLSWLPLLIPIPFIHTNTNTNTVPVPVPVPEMNSGVGFGIGVIVIVLGLLGSSVVRQRKRNEA